MYRMHEGRGIAKVLGWGLLGLLLMCSPACREQGDKGGNVAVRDINTVMETHASELMKISGVTGVAIGAQDDGTPCILVLILEDSDKIKAQIPEAIEGYQVKIMVSGQIEPMQGDSGG